MQIRVWAHPKGIIRVTIIDEFSGKSVPLDYVDPASVAEWLEKAEMDNETKEILEAYLQNWL